MRRSGADVYHFAVQRCCQARVFAFRVDDDNLRVLVLEQHPKDFILGEEGLAGAGSAEQQAVRGLQIVPVKKYQIMRHGILAIVDATGFVQFLSREWNKNCS